AKLQDISISERHRPLDPRLQNRRAARKFQASDRERYLDRGTTGGPGVISHSAHAAFEQARRNQIGLPESDLFTRAQLVYKFLKPNVLYLKIRDSHKI